MRRILDRYILREVATTWFLVTAVLLIILLTNQFARVLGRAAEGDIPKDTVFALLGLTSVQYLNVLVPVALFLAVMLGLGRLYRDSEMAAIMGCGVSQMRLYRPIMLWAGLLAGGLGWLALDVGPWAAARTEILMDEGRRQAELRSLEAGRFASTRDGRVVFYAERIAEDGVLENVFVQRRSGDRVEIAVAARGTQVHEEAGEGRTMVLYDGRRYEGVPGSLQFRVTSFAEHGIPITLPARESKAADAEALPTSALWDSRAPADVAELQWRLSVPISALLLSFLAVPLARTAPRQGRYGKLAFGVLIYIIYSNLLGASRIWVEREEVPLELGLWWVHGLLGLGALALLARQYGLAGLLGPNVRPLPPKEAA